MVQLPNGEQKEERYTVKVTGTDCEKAIFLMENAVVWNIKGELLDPKTAIAEMSKPKKVFLITYAEGQKRIPEYKYEPYYAEVLKPDVLIVRVNLDKRLDKKN